MGEIRVGTCGFCLPQPRYYRTFGLIELQQTFYQPPRLATVESWRREAPADFEFTLKAFQAITHPPGSPTYRRSRLTDAERGQCGGFCDTPVVRQAWEATRRIAAALKARIVIFQCPASLTPTDSNVAALRRFFAWAERGRLRFGWEPRGPAWTDELVRELCRELDLLHVVDPFVRPPARPTRLRLAPRRREPLRRGKGPPLHGGTYYFRLHGIGGYRYRYTDADLRRLRDCCTARTTYCLFNNLAMAQDAQRFIQITAE